MFLSEIRRMTCIVSPYRLVTFIIQGVTWVPIDQLHSICLTPAEEKIYIIMMIPRGHVMVALKMSFVV